jgi:hypothetical protein
MTHNFSKAIIFVVFLLIAYRSENMIARLVLVLSSLTVFTNNNSTGSFEKEIVLFFQKIKLKHFILIAILTVLAGWLGQKLGL